MLTEERSWGQMGPTGGPGTLGGLLSTVRAEAVSTGESSVRGLFHSIFETSYYQE